MDTAKRTYLDYVEVPASGVWPPEGDHFPVLATYKVAKAVKLPVIGVGGIAKATDIIQYIIAGATLVAIGTAVMQRPRLAEKLVEELERWCREKGVKSLNEVRGSFVWES